jgi:hypothetical protein
MKTQSLILSFFIFCISFGQSINYNKFDSDKMNSALLFEMNSFRKTLYLDTLVYSNFLYLKIAKPNCEEVVLSGSFYHPIIDEYWKTSDVKDSIGSETLKKVGGILNTRTKLGKPGMLIRENAYRTSLRFASYQDAAKHVIESWKKSEGHHMAQTANYSDQNLPGVFACHSILSSDGFVYIYIEFVKVYRLSTF